MTHGNIALALVLVSAFMHAAWNTVVKAGTSRFLTLALVDASAFLICLVALPLVGPPSLRVWFYIALSVLLNTAYRLFLIRAYDTGDFGQVYPVVRGIPPVLVALFSATLLNEHLSFCAFVGVALISVGIVSLAGIRRASRHLLLPVAMAMLAGLFIAGYTIIDAKGVRASASVLQYIIYLTLFQSIPIPLLAMARNRRAFIGHVRTRGIIGGLGGVFYLASYGLVLLAFSLTSVAKVSALRETSVIIAAVIAALFFREGFGLRRIASAAVILCGILLIKMSA